MSNTGILLLTLYLLSGLSFIMLAWRVKTFKDNKVTKIFYYLTIIGAIWVFSNLIELASPTLSGTMFWAKLKYIGIVFLPVTWFLFSLEYTGKVKYVNKKTTILFSIIPVINLITQWSNQYHYLFYQSISITDIEGITYFTAKLGPMFWFNTIYSYIMISIGIVLIIYSLTSLHRFYWKPAVLIAIGVLTPLIGNLFYNMTSVITLDITPLLLTVAVLSLAYGIENFDFLGALIIGRKTVFDKIKDPILVLDKDKEIIDLNKSAENLLRKTSEEKDNFIGKDAKKLFNKTINIEKVMKSNKTKDKLCKINMENEIKHYQIQANSLKESQNKPIGWNLIIRDVTKREKNKEEKKFLYTLLRQDLNTKFQTIQGYLRLLEDIEIPEKYNDYIEKGLNTGKEADQILKLVKKLEEIEKTDWYEEKNIKNTLKQAKQDVKELAEKNNVKIKEKYPKNMEKIIGNYSLETLITGILKLRIKAPKVTKIKINVTNKEKNINLTIKDNGKKLPEETIKLYKGEHYTGETSGIGGVRYYTLKEIAKHNKVKINVKNQKNGTKFQILIKKANKISKNEKKKT